MYDLEILAGAARTENFGASEIMSCGFSGDFDFSMTILGSRTGGASGFSTISMVFGV